ncbi:MAG: hypothetical protein DRP95_00075 [Candidatus Latescibacterota bacterium]|nr:MAG: hypothetical protein DRP95_00075 [Candidatus Latescibacterota bacterium]
MSILIYIAIFIIIFRLLQQRLLRWEYENYVQIPPFDFTIPYTGGEGEISKVFKSIVSQLEFSPEIGPPPKVAIKLYGFEIYSFKITGKPSKERLSRIAKAIKLAITSGLYKTRIERVKGGIRIYNKEGIKLPLPS